MAAQDAGAQVAFLLAIFAMSGAAALLQFFLVRRLRSVKMKGMY
jgi:hypothetical protein